MKKRFSAPLTAMLLAFSVSACASTGAQSVGRAASNVPSVLTSAPDTAAATSDPVADATLVTVPPGPATTTTTTTTPHPAATTAAHPAVATHTTAPAPHPATTRPAPKPTTAAQPAATCEHHATIDEGTARCGAGEPHAAGEMAECWDGTPSYSQTPSGTCSHHQGVEVWYY